MDRVAAAATGNIEGAIYALKLINTSLDLGDFCELMRTIDTTNNAFLIGQKCHFTSIFLNHLKTNMKLCYESVLHEHAVDVRPFYMEVLICPSFSAFASIHARWSALDMTTLTSAAFEFLTEFFEFVSVANFKISCPSDEIDKELRALNGERWRHSKDLFARSVLDLIRLGMKRESMQCYLYNVYAMGKAGED